MVGKFYVSACGADSVQRRPGIWRIDARGAYALTCVLDRRHLRCAVVFMTISVGPGRRYALDWPSGVEARSHSGKRTLTCVAMVRRERAKEVHHRSEITQ
jgi:hypothetical protein